MSITSHVQLPCAKKKKDEAQWSNSPQWQTVAMRKAEDLKSMEDRLKTAEQLAEGKGDTRRAAAYKRQAAAAREERYKWLHIIHGNNNASLRSGHSHLLVAALCLVSPVLQSLLGGLPFRRLSHVSLMAVLLYVGVLVAATGSASKPSMTSMADAPGEGRRRNGMMPKPWTVTLAQSELGDKCGSSPHLMYAMRNKH